MERIGPVLDEALPELPDILLWDLRVDSQVPTMASELVPAEVAEIKNAIDLQCDPVTATITTSVKPDFWRGLSNADNRAEAALVEAFIRGALQLARAPRMTPRTKHYGIKYHFFGSFKAS